MAENQFNPALPLPIKWSIGDDRFNEGQQERPPEIEHD